MTTKFYSFYSDCFIRLIASRLQSETFQAAYPSVQNALEKRTADLPKRLDNCKSSNGDAFDFFETEFSRLLPDEQKALSGHTRSEWIKLEQGARNS